MEGSLGPPPQPLPLLPQEENPGATPPLTPLKVGRHLIKARGLVSERGAPATATGGGGGWGTGGSGRRAAGRTPPPCPRTRAARGAWGEEQRPWKMGMTGSVRFSQIIQTRVGFDQTDALNEPRVVKGFTLLLRGLRGNGGSGGTHTVRRPHTQTPPPPPPPHTHAKSPTP